MRISDWSSDVCSSDLILNVNVPDLPWEEVAGFEVARLGNRHRAEPCIQQQDPRGRDWWWIGPAGPELDSGAGTDFHAVRTGHISITPIHVDLTRYQALEQVRSEEHTSELQSLMRISYAVFCLKKKKKN